jgi:hypothetical protein
LVFRKKTTTLHNWVPLQFGQLYTTMEDDLNLFENGRQPEFFGNETQPIFCINERRPDFFEKILVLFET